VIGRAAQNIRIPTALQATLRDASGATRGSSRSVAVGLFLPDPGPPAVQGAVPRQSLRGPDVDLEAEVLYIVSFEEGPFCERVWG